MNFFNRLEVHCLAIHTNHRRHTADNFHRVARVWTNHQLAGGNTIALTSHDYFFQIRQDFCQYCPEVERVSYIRDDTLRKLPGDQVFQEGFFGKQPANVIAFRLRSKTLLNAQDVACSYSVLSCRYRCGNKALLAVVLHRVQHGPERIGAKERAQWAKATTSCILWPAHTACREVVTLIRNAFYWAACT
ncbi:hypothetical protein D3C80_1327780 [compost metagenome]